MRCTVISALVPFSYKYFNTTYDNGKNPNFDIQRYMKTEVLPLIARKLSSIGKFDDITFLTDIELPEQLFQIDNTIKFQDSNGLDENTIENLMEFHLKGKKLKYLLVFNPLFPFIDKSTIETLILAVIEKQYEASTVGTQGTSLWLNGKPISETTNENTKSLHKRECFIDLGACYFIDLKFFNAKKSRLSQNTKFFKAGNLEGINLRDVNDIALVDLILSTGIGGHTF